ncbi:ShlB/FhaC/HecB family hemolysin secretion/activation protein [Rhizobium sp. S153]|uniref:ShlB/FhaC/HecB family hemolysin secretion/activation protein n=1 Tax=Ciceribacter sichuanensis TaxID=2949647 RepID=A0ABT0V9F1_9HYPH|nr:ShlB/FhaC/HecB family hemolysin secretion/activation protein [Ciceribacter sp. S153]MCM2402512.1 ShlB/FhaC/HecB family hemolysin secretion/activation protein [Ciceribacter sp. S153]
MNTYRHSIPERIRASVFDGPATLAILMTLAAAGQAAAQSAVERNPPPAVTGNAPTITLPEEAAVEADKRPLGADLAAIRLIGAKEEPSAGNAAGVVVGDIGPGHDLEPQLAGVLRPFIGKPLSLSLIAEAQAAIAGVYRRAGYPFVSVTIPPQEITGGVLNLRVMEFGFGSVTARGVEGERARSLAAQVNAPAGGRISSAGVNEDLSWLNRSPFRRVQGLFSPGSDVGRSDLALEVTRGKPWQVYAGYSNTGAEGTDRDRFFLGAGFAIPGIDGAFGSYQLTGSPDLFEDLGGIFPDHDDHRARYVSHSGTFVVPIEGRQAIDFSPAFIATRQESDLFTFDTSIVELPLYYRSALSNILPGIYGGEVYAGIEYKHLSRDTFFSDIRLGSANAELFQFGLGISKSFSDDLGSTRLDLHVKANPGGIFSDNSDSAWNTFSNGAVTDVSYAYLGGSLSRQTELGHDFQLNSDVLFQLAGQALPDTERLALGGLDGVRGYDLDDAVADTGVIIRNELRSPVVSPTGKDRLSPFAFLDLGFGRDKAADEGLSLASTGAGIDYDIAGNFSLHMTAAIALVDEGDREAGDMDFKIRLSARY